MITDADLLRRVDAFLERSGMAPTRLGLDTLGDGGLVKQLREGRSLTLKSANKVLDFIEAWEAENPRPSSDPGKAVDPPFGGTTEGRNLPEDIQKVAA